jgi:hypothetical protein
MLVVSTSGVESTDFWELRLVAVKEEPLNKPFFLSPICLIGKAEALEALLFR